MARLRGTPIAGCVRALLGHAEDCQLVPFQGEGVGIFDPEASKAHCLLQSRSGADGAPELVCGLGAEGDRIYLDGLLYGYNDGEWVEIDRDALEGKLNTVTRSHYAKLFGREISDYEWNLVILRRGMQPAVPVELTKEQFEEALGRKISDEEWDWARNRGNRGVERPQTPTDSEDR